MNFVCQHIPNFHRTSPLWTRKDARNASDRSSFFLISFHSWTSKNWCDVDNDCWFIKELMDLYISPHPFIYRYSYVSIRFFFSGTLLFYKAFSVIVVSLSLVFFSMGFHLSSKQALINMCMACLSYFFRLLVSLGNFHTTPSRWLGLVTQLYGFFSCFGFERGIWRLLSVNRSFIVI